MRKFGLHTRLWLVTILILAGTLFAGSYRANAPELDYSDTMRQAAELAQKWMSLIGRKKAERGIGPGESITPNNFMIGNAWSEITTTLGSLESKEISTNPDFAALVVRLLHEAGITAKDTVGVILSGSFPAIAVSVLAALQTMELEAVIISSPGASTYGANQPGATWLDMEGWLRREGGLRYQSRLISPGAGADRGEGLTAEGRTLLSEASRRNGYTLYVPASLPASIEYKTDLFLNHHISLLINIGGNMAALGSCVHAATMPNGLNRSMHHCNHEGRGVITRVNEAGIPFIHFLNLKEIAFNYGMDPSPAMRYAESMNLYHQDGRMRGIPIIVLLLSLAPLIILKKDTTCINTSL